MDIDTGSSGDDTGSSCILTQVSHGDDKVPHGDDTGSSW